MNWLQMVRIAIDRRNGQRPVFTGLLSINYRAAPKCAYGIG